MNYGIQLYSVKDLMAENLKDTITKIGEIGYKAIEPTPSIFEIPSKDFKVYCEEAGVLCHSIHSGINLLIDDFDNIVKYLKVIGCKRYILPLEPTGSKKELDETIKHINKFEPMLKAEGIELMYHNHHREFVPNADGQIPHIELQKRTNIKFEIDVYWVYRGLNNPIYVLESLKDRIDVIHLKDGDMIQGKPLGQGCVPIYQVVQWAKENGVDMVVENEPTVNRQMVEAEECINYLKSLD